MNRTLIQTDDAPQAIGPYSQAVRFGDFLFTSGQVAIDPATNEFVGGDIEAQTRLVLSNLRAVLAAAGAGMGDVVKTTVFLTTMDNFAAMNAIYAEAFGEAPPARSTVAVAGLPKGALVEIECIAQIRGSSD